MLLAAHRIPLLTGMQCMCQAVYRYALISDTPIHCYNHHTIKHKHNVVFVDACGFRNLLIIICTNSTVPTLFRIRKLSASSKVTSWFTVWQCFPALNTSQIWQTVSVATHQLIQKQFLTTCLTPGVSLSLADYLEFHVGLQELSISLIPEFHCQQDAELQ